MILQLRPNATIFIGNKYVVKRFRGPNSKILKQREIEGQFKALSTNVWKPLVLKSSTSFFSIIFSPRCREVDASEEDEIFLFVCAITENSLKNGDMEKASRVVKLNNLLIRDLFFDLSDRPSLLIDFLSKFNLPVGPTHGDLHIGNIVKCSRKIKVIDFDRFNLYSCPLFDRVSFIMHQLKESMQLPWLDILINNDSYILEKAGVSNFSERELLGAYALNRIQHECLTSKIRNKSLLKYSKQFDKLINYIER